MVGIAVVVEDHGFAGRPHVAGGRQKKSHKPQNQLFSTTANCTQIARLHLRNQKVAPMSTASKITFGLTCLSAAGAFVFINYSQQAERAALRQGPIKDAARVKAKQEMTKKQLANELEHREQIELREKYEKVQPLSGDIIRGEEQ